MRFWLRFLLIAVLAYAAQQFLPFWSAVLAAFAVGLAMSRRRRRRYSHRILPPAQAFLAGFLALFLLWGGMAWMTDAANASILSTRISQIIIPAYSLPLPGAWFMILLTALLGGLLGGLGAMSGNQLGEALRG
jgi:Kef-type K+ transport system membrane component KefB